MIHPIKWIAKEKDTIKITCRSYGRPSWMYNNTYIKNKHTLSSKRKVHTLTLKKLTIQNTGEYTCHGWTNNYEPFWSVAEVTVQRQDSKRNSMIQ